jgi:alpha-1,2-mannosyltransferase
VLWILASVAIALLCYEVWTLLFSVLAPLAANPAALQTDFHYYYDAAVRYSADHSRLYLASDDVIAGFAYPPPAIVPFLLLSKMPLGAALALMTAASYAALIVSFELWWTYLRRHGLAVDRRTRIAVLLIAAASGPAYMNAVFGQVNAFVLLAAVVFVSMAAKTPMVAGVALAAGTWLKIYPAFLVLLGGWNARVRRAIGFAAAGALVIAVVLLPLVPIAAYQAFVTLLPRRAGITAIHITNQSFVAFLERFRYAPELFLNWTGHEAVAVTPIARAMQAVLAAGVVAALWLQSRNDHARFPVAAASMMALVAVISPLGWGHTYVMALPLVMLQLIAMREASPARATLIFVCAGAMMIPAGRHLPIDSVPAWLQNAVYSRYLLATVTLVLISTVPADRSARTTRVASA